MRQLQELGHDVVDGRSAHAGHMELLGQELGPGVNRMLVLGGDGSLRETVKGVLRLHEDARPAVGALPFGNGNVMAREAALPMGALDAMAALLKGGVTTIDVGYATASDGEEELFLGMAGAGYDAAVATGIANCRRTRLGGALYRFNADMIYGALGLREMVRLAPPRFSVDVDGERLTERAAAAVVSSVRTYGKGMTMTPSAAWDDGRLGVHVRHSAAPWKTIRALWAAQRGKEAPGWAATYAAGCTVTIRAPATSSFPWQLDGDAMGRTTSLSIRIEPRSLRFLRAPEAAADKARP